MSITRVVLSLFKSRWRRLTYILLIIIFLFISYLIFTSFWAYTSDAYISAHFSRVNSHTSGYVKNIAVNDYQQVNQGDTLFNIDPTPYQLKLKRAQTQLAIANHALQQSQTKIQVDKAKLNLAQNRLQLANKKLQRYQKLKKQDRVAQQTVDNQQSQADLKQKQLDIAKQQLKSERLKLKTEHAKRQKAQTSIALARYHLNQTQVRAPYKGYVTKLKIGKGTYMQAGDEAFAIIKQHSWYVLANIKESYLSSIDVGDSAYIQTDLGGWFNWLKGHVVQISPAISRKPNKKRPVIPYVKPRLNWIRLQRRFPVKIKIDHPPKHPLLRFGANARVLIRH